jgi:hypothetical protein
MLIGNPHAPGSWTNSRMPQPPARTRACSARDGPSEMARATQ